MHGYVYFCLDYHIIQSGLTCFQLVQDAAATGLTTKAKGEHITHHSLQNDVKIWDSVCGLHVFCLILNFI